jgi:hypothetical protein
MQPQRALRRRAAGPVGKQIVDARMKIAQGAGLA